MVGPYFLVSKKWIIVGLHQKKLPVALKFWRIWILMVHLLPEMENK